jgi:hypothetical protein
LGDLSGRAIRSVLLQYNLVDSVTLYSIAQRTNRVHIRKTGLIFSLSWIFGDEQRLSANGSHVQNFLAPHMHTLAFRASFRASLRSFSQGFGAARATGAAAPPETRPFAASIACSGVGHVFGGEKRSKLTAERARMSSSSMPVSGTPITPPRSFFFRAASAALAACKKNQNHGPLMDKNVLRSDLILLLALRAYLG